MILTLLVLTCAAQQGSTNLYDLNGVQVRGQGGQPAILPNAEILHSFQGTLPLGFSGIARNGTMIAANGENDLNAVIYLFDENTGEALNTIPVPFDSYFGLGYDSLRDRYIATTGSAQSIDILDSAGNLIVSFPGPEPGTSPVGAAYDSNRDVYWITSYPSINIISIDPNTGVPIQSYLNNAQRISDCGYDPVHDVLIYGARTAGEVYFMDASNGTILKRHSAATNPILANDPPGLTFSSSGDLWQCGSETDRFFLTNARQSRSVALAATGGLPGLVTIQVTGATPYRRVALAFGPAGSFTVLGGACAGVTLAIDNPTRVGFYGTKTPGEIAITPFLSSAMIGMTVQAVDMKSCTVSNTLVL